MGAAGATPVGLIWLSRLIYGTDDHVRLLPGAAVVAQELGLLAAITQADLVITGEGRFDEQSSHGKVISQIAQLVDAAGQNSSEKPGPVLAIAAAEFSVQPGDNVFAVQLEPGKAVADQLRAAGAEIARKFQQTRS